MFFENKTCNKMQLLLLSLLLLWPEQISKCVLCQVHISTVLLAVLLEILTLQSTYRLLTQLLAFTTLTYSFL